MLILKNIQTFSIKSALTFGTFLFFCTANAGLAQTGDFKTFKDPKGRFTFDYPADWGKVSSGTNNGFRNRVSALRFSKFSSKALGGELIMTKGFISFDLQLLGGLYDDIALEMVKDDTRSRLKSILPPPIINNFCKLLETPEHFHPGHRILKFLPESELNALEGLDKMRNIKPKVHQCDVNNHTITFHKEVTFKAGKIEKRQHLYGAIRFLKNKYSSFQIVRGDVNPPSPALLKTIADVVSSWRYSR